MTIWIGRSVLAGLLLAQTAEPTLDQQYRTAIGVGSHHALVTLIAVHTDGTPVRGDIYCAGFWQKYQDLLTDEKPKFYENLAFKTDSRGAVVMNPRTNNEWVTCWAEDGGKRGSVVVEFSDNNPSHVAEIVLTGGE
jgi:hypothetical protein